jgi:hypothetical protein
MYSELLGEEPLNATWQSPCQQPGRPSHKAWAEHCQSDRRSTQGGGMGREQNGRWQHLYRLAADIQSEPQLYP